MEHRPLAPSLAGVRARPERKRGAETCVKVSISESLLQRREGGLACAMAGSDVLDFERVLERRHRLCDDVVWGEAEMEAADDQTNFRIDGHRRLDDPFDSRVRAADHEHHAVRGINSQERCGIFPALSERAISDRSRELAPSAIAKHRIHHEAAARADRERRPGYERGRELTRPFLGDSHLQRSLSTPTNHLRRELLLPCVSTPTAV